MTSNGLLQIAIYFVVLLALTKPLGTFHGAACSTASELFCTPSSARLKC